MPIITLIPVQFETKKSIFILFLWNLLGFGVKIAYINYIEMYANVARRAARLGL